MPHGLTLRRIAKTVGKQTILRDISLDVRPGEFLTLVGPSGCGKSTLLRIIAGLDRQSSGEVWIGGRRADDLPPKHRDVAMVFQSYALYPHMTVRANVAVPLRMRRLKRWQRMPVVRSVVPSVRREETRIADKVDEITRSLAIEHLLARKPRELSGGQRQRVALARAMVREPAIFLMDEPLSNLDAAMRIQARAEIAQLHRRLGVTFIYVTHDQTEAMTMSDRVVVMLQGELLQIDTPETIYSAPADLRVAAFVGTPKINVLEGQVVRDGTLEAGGGVFQVPSGIAVGTRMSVGIRPEALKPADHGMAARVTHVENLGSDILVHATLASNDQTIIARLDPFQTARPTFGSEIKLAPLMERILLFDDAGNRIPSTNARSVA